MDAGERIFVKRFDLTGAVDRPELGIHKEEVQGLLESQRVAREKLTGVGPDGFTKEERQQITAFMHQVVDSPDLDMKFDDYQALVDKIRLQKQEREKGLTIGQVQQIADEVTKYYRKAGFLLAKAYVPAQEVKDGVVKIEVVEGTLGKVTAQGNQRFSDAMLARPFTDLIDAPVVADSMERALSLLTDYPGISVFGVLQPGEFPGTTDLVLKVQKEKRFSGSAYYDNHGSGFTGERRLGVDVDINNPLFAADKLSVTLQQAFWPRRNFYGSFNYEIPAFAPDWSIGGGFNRNGFTVGKQLADQHISGVTEAKDIYLSSRLIRGRTTNLRAKLDLVRKTAQTRQQSVLQSEDNLAYLGLELSYDTINKESQSLIAATVRLDHGLSGFGVPSPGELQQRVPGSSRPTTARGVPVGSNYDKLTVAYAQLLKLSAHQSLLWRVNGQLAKDPLVSVEQFAIGGPDSVRAYPVSEYLMDRGYFTSLEWTVDAPGLADKPAFGGHNWGDVLRLSFFADYAQGWLNYPTANDIGKTSLLGAGMGIQLNLPWDLSARFQAARPIGADRPSDGEPMRYWFDLRYSF